MGDHLLLQYEEAEEAMTGKNDLVEKVAEALAKVPCLWLRHIEGEGRWQVCHWVDHDTDELVILATKETLSEAQHTKVKLIGEMRARAAIAVTIEACAGVCDDIRIQYWDSEPYALEECAQAIRSLMETGE